MAGGLNISRGRGSTSKRHGQSTNFVLRPPSDAACLLLATATLLWQTAPLYIMVFGMSVKVATASVLALAVRLWVGDMSVVADACDRDVGPPVPVTGASPAQVSLTVCLSLVLPRVVVIALCRRVFWSCRSRGHLMVEPLAGSVSFSGPVQRCNVLCPQGG